MQTREELKAKMERISTERKQFITLEDGYVYFWPTGPGAASASELRMLAEILDEKNAKWDAQVKEDLGYHE